MRNLLLVVASLLYASPSSPADYGILLMAHGGNAQWNAEVSAIAASLQKQAPVETALGMGDAAALQAAVERLEKRGVKRIVAVPLFIHSRSEVMDQTRYALGLSPHPSEILRDAMAAMPAMTSAPHGGAGHMPHFSMERVRASAPITMTAALDDSPLLTELLLRRARALSRAPARETVVLVAHGPVDSRANEAWLSTMRGHAGRLRAGGGFRVVVALTIRDDAAPSVKRPALAALRASVTKASRDGGRAIVIPYLIARGGIESHITEALKGLAYAWDGKTLCPDKSIELWAAKSASEGAQSSIKK